jgi:hypothetical protein
MIRSTCVDYRVPIFRRGMHQSITLSHSLVEARHCLTQSAPARSANDRQLGPEAQKLLLGDRRKDMFRARWRWSALGPLVDS